MNVQEIFQALNLTLKGRNWADIAPGVTLHLSEVAGQVLWVVVANYEAVGDGWIDLDENTAETLGAVVETHKSTPGGFAAEVWHSLN